MDIFSIIINVGKLILFFVSIKFILEIIIIVGF